MGSAQKVFDSGHESDSVSCNILVAGYIKTGCLDRAQKVFDEMPDKGCVSYTTMILGLVKDDCFEEAIRVFKDMRWHGVMPNEVTMSSVISAYVHVGGIRNCRVLHGFVKKIGLEDFILVSTNLVHMYCICSHLSQGRFLFDEIREPNSVTWNVMLNGYSKAGMIELASDLFENFPIKDVVSWGTIISCFVQDRNLDKAFSMYRRMMHTSLCPNEVMIVDIVSACAQSMAFLEGLQFHSIAIRLGFDNYDFVQTTLIHFYAFCQRVIFSRKQFEFGRKDHIPSWNALISGLLRNGLVDLARNYFDKMPERDIFSWSSMISGYTRSQQPNLALELFRNMVDQGVKPNEITMMSVLSAISSLGILKDGIWAHEYIVNNSILLNDNLCAAIIDMYAKCGSIKTSLEFFQKIHDSCSTVSPWNAIICGLAMHGLANLSLKIFSDLQKRRIKLNSITFMGVLCACCHAGLVEEGEKHFKNMKKLYDVEPNIKHYGCMVDLLGRAGKLKEAEELIRGMPMNADIVIWGTLLGACKTHGNVEIGEWAAENLARAEPTHGGSRVALSSIYADAGRWEDAFSIRREIKSQQMTRSLAYSGVV